MGYDFNQVCFLKNRRKKYTKIPKKIYTVNLTEDERTYLLNLFKGGKHPARKLNRARILLLADDGKTDEAIEEALHIGFSTVGRIRKKFVEGGLKYALNELPRPGGEVIDSISDETVRRTLKKMLIL